MFKFIIKCVSILATLWMINCGELTKSYQVYEEQVPWLTAYQKCIADGMQLATISNGEENYLIQRVIEKSSSKIFWTSGVRDNDENDFLWWNSVPVSYTKWMPNEPDNFGNYENCISIHRGKGEWSDSNCYMKYGFICESVAHSSHKSRLSTNNHPSLNSKDDGVHTYTTYSQKESWMDAHRRCLSENSHLVAIAAEHDNKMVSEQLQQSILSDDTNTLYWTSGIQGAGQKDFYWWNTDPVFYSNWDHSGLAKTSDKQSCVAIDSQGKWFVEDCEKQLGFICENSLLSISTKNDHVLKKYESYYRKWYTLNDKFSSKKEAELACASSQGHLLSIMHKNEYKSIKQFIFGRAPESVEFYISAVCPNGTKIFRWWTNKLVPSLLVWESGHPTIEECVILNYRGALETTKCKERFNSICEYFEVTEPITPELIERDCCKSVEVAQQIKVYHVFNDEVDWNSALQECRNKNMKLATARSVEEAILLYRTIHSSDKYSPSIYYWMAGRRRGDSGRYEWNDQNEPLTFTHWEDQQPDFYKRNEFCLQNKGISGWNDLDCNKLNRFVCEEVKPIEPAKIESNCFTELRNRFDTFYNELSENLKKLRYLQHNC